MVIEAAACPTWGRAVDNDAGDPVHVESHRPREGL